MLNISHTVYPEENIHINDWFKMVYQPKSNDIITTNPKIPETLGYFKIHIFKSTINTIKNYLKQ